jgi:predicted metal-dependent hydrolase
VKAAEGDLLPGFEVFAPPLPPRVRAPSPLQSVPPPFEDETETIEPITAREFVDEPESFTVEVIRSKRRKRTVGATLVGTKLTVTVPHWMAQADVDKWVDEMTKRWQKKRSTQSIDLADRADTLARRYDLPKPSAIRWDDMKTQWGSCTPAHATIRISSRLAAFPPWVLDYVIVHELSHIEMPDHSPAFWKLVQRYPRTERARGYLIAKANDDENE